LPSSRFAFQRPAQHFPTLKATLAVSGVLFVWLGTTATFWIGYVGSDDLFYSRYAFLFHRPPINWWEFRIPAVLAIRTSFAAFGPTEFAAALPSLLSSLLILASVAWQVDWLNRPRWESTLAMILAATLPLDVGFRSVPGAALVAAGFLSAGSVCVLKGRALTPLLGSALLAIGCLTHEASLFYAAIFCAALLVFAWERFWKSVLLYAVLAGGLFVVEAVIYHFLLGDLLARFRTAAALTASQQSIGDPGCTVAGVAFVLWPLQNLVFGKQFGLDLILLLIAGAVAWRCLSIEQRILLCTTFGLYFWIGYGSLVPWSYRPFCREFHFHLPLTFAIASLLPFSLAYACKNRVWVARGVVVAAVVLHFFWLSVGGRWGQHVRVSEELLRFANHHPDKAYVTDVATLNHMYVLAGFKLPNNVMCIAGPAVDRHLLINKEPLGVARISFPTKPIDGVLVNLEGLLQAPPEKEFLSYLNALRGDRHRIAPVRYRPLFVLLRRSREPKDFMVRSLGGELVRIGG
jgi:hypothetical protein